VGISRFGILPKEGLGINTIEISHHPFMIGMNSGDSSMTPVTHGIKAFIRVDSDGHHLLFFIKRLFHHLDSTKIKECIQLDLGHRSASSGLVFLIQTLYPEEQAVSIFFVIIDQRFGRRTRFLNEASRLLLFFISIWYYESTIIL